MAVIASLSGQVFNISWSVSTGYYTGIPSSNPRQCLLYIYIYHPVVSQYKL